MYPGIATDCNIEETWQSNVTAKRCDTQLRLKANDIRRGEGERNKAPRHPSDGNGNNNSDGNRRQVLGGCWHRWQRKWNFAVENYLVMGEYNVSN